MKEIYVCIHGHFYQPPRENPYIEEVELQDSAHPFHDWNERITAECYAPNTASRILDDEGRIIDMVNNYSKISFNFGPTLLYWLERHKPDVYRAVIQADKLSMERFSGHGSAIAQAYNHVIMPLSNRRDMYTQALWGIRDFQKRFGRYPEGMWLPETAACTESLEVLAELGIKFTILAPRQAKRIRSCADGDEQRRRAHQAAQHPNDDRDPGRDGGHNDGHNDNIDDSWTDVSGTRVDPRMPYICRLPSGGSITLFFYDGYISQEIAFGDLLIRGENFAGRLLSTIDDNRGEPQMIHIGTDGETYGHHHRKGEMALSYCLHLVENGDFNGGRNVKLTNYAEFLSKHPPTWEAEIYDGSSWSCVHGIGRWSDDCGCNSGTKHGWTQKWRRPLRDALDGVRNRLAEFFEAEAPKYFKENPWDVRNDYIEVVMDRSKATVEGFLQRHAVKFLQHEETVCALKLLEMQRNAMLMYTSCGWFFDEVSGIETVQIMNYASRAMSYAEELAGLSIEAEFVEALKKAPSNCFENGAWVYENFVKPARVDLRRVAAHYAVSSLFEDYPELFSYRAGCEGYEKLEDGKRRLAVGKAIVNSTLTWEERTVAVAVVHAGDLNITCGAVDFPGEKAYAKIKKELAASFKDGMNKGGDIADTVGLIYKHFGGNIYTLRHLFKDEQRAILNRVLKSTFDTIEGIYRNVFEVNHALMDFLVGLQAPIPISLKTAASTMINGGIIRILEASSIDEARLMELARESVKWGITVDKDSVRYLADGHLDSLMAAIEKNPMDTALYERVDRLIDALNVMSVGADLWRAQNIFFSIGQAHYRHKSWEASQANEQSARWVEVYRRLGGFLGVRAD